MTNIAGLGSGAIFLMWSVAALCSAAMVPRVSCPALLPLKSALLRNLLTGIKWSVLERSLTSLHHGPTLNVWSPAGRYRRGGSCRPASSGRSRRRSRQCLVPSATTPTSSTRYGCQGVLQPPLTSCLPVPVEQGHPRRLSTMASHVVHDAQKTDTVPELDSNGLLVASPITAVNIPSHHDTASAAAALP